MATDTERNRSDDVNIFYIFFLKNFQKEQKCASTPARFISAAAVSMKMQVSEGGGDGICGTGQGACCAGSNDGCPAEASECRKKRKFRK